MKNNTAAGSAAAAETPQASTPPKKSAQPDGAAGDVARPAPGGAGQQARKGPGPKGQAGKAPGARTAQAGAQPKGKVAPGKGKGGQPQAKGQGGGKAGRQRPLHNVPPPRPGAPAEPVLPAAPAARRKARHVGIFFSFLLFVVAPVAVASWYLFERAADQYASQMGFTVRKEEGASAAEVLGGAFDFGSSATSDTDILYEFIQSQGLVERVDARLNLREIYSRPQNDPVFSIASDAPIEDLVRYWQRMVTIYYDAGTGLIETRVRAFTPEHAQAISRAIFDESSAMINRLSKVARDDATRYAREELAQAEARVRAARSALTEFRARTQLVDPNIDIQGQMGLLNNLQAQLAEALIELDMLQENTREGDPRLRQAEQRIDVIETRIAEERKQFGIGETVAGDRAYASLVGDYETLSVDREFAEQTYLAALANFDSAQAEALRKTRYLAAYAQPTLAQSAEYPQRFVVLGLIALFAGTLWSIGVLVYYSVRDRR